VWERRSHTKHKGRLICLQEFPHWIFLFHFSATLPYTRKLVIYSFVPLQALHAEIEMTNLNLKVTLLVRKGAGTPFPPQYTPAQARGGAMGTIAPPIPKVEPKMFRLVKLFMCKPKKYFSANQRNCFKTFRTSAFSPRVSNTRPAGHMWLARTFCTARDAVWE